MKSNSSNNKKIIAMWSGPRNISTAMMRAWENRPDTIVVDEPLYGYYLAKTGKQHPMTDEIIADQGSDGNAIIERITQLDFAKKQGNDTDLDIFYQKHMCHHILDDLDLSWLGIPHHVFLIRSPEDVITSYAKRMDEVNLQGLGFTQQAELFDRISDINGEAPLVVNSVDVLINPEKTLSTICQKIGIPFYQDMLSWPAGERDSDGVWADHWYANVRKTTGFNSYQPKASNLPLDYAKIAERAQPYYEKLKPFALSLS